MVVTRAGAGRSLASSSCTSARHNLAVVTNTSLDSMGARALVARLASGDEHLATLWRENPSEPKFDAEG